MSNAINSATGGYLFKTIGRKTRYLHVEAAKRRLDDRFLMAQKYIT